MKPRRTPSVLLRYTSFSCARRYLSLLNMRKNAPISSASEITIVIILAPVNEPTIEMTSAAITSAMLS